MSDETGDEKGTDFQKEVEGIMEGAAGLFGTLREIFDKSRDEIARASRLGKTRIDLFQLEKDREHFLQRLGEECFELMKDGTIAHDDLNGPYEKLTVLDERKAEYEAEVERIATEQAAAQEQKAANEAGDVVDGELVDGEGEATEEAPEPAPSEPAAVEAEAEVEPAPAPDKKKAPKRKPKKPKKDL
jgi:hypothetical protein